MASVTDKTIAATATSILAAADWKTLGTPVYLKNESVEIITLTISSADDYSLDPGETLQVIPGQVITGTAVGGAALLQIITGIVPSDESASKGGGSVVAGGSASATVSRATWSKGQGDFTAVYASAVTLTLGGFPTALGTPDDGDFYLVVSTDVNGLQTAYVPTRNAMTLGGQVLTVVGAAFDATDLDYDVFIWGPPKSYDASINGDQTRELSPVWARQISSTIADATDVTDATVYYPSTAGVDIDGYLYAILQLAADCDLGTVTVTLEASAQDDGTAGGSAVWFNATLGLFGVASLVSAAAPASDEWVIDTPFPVKRIRLKAVYATGDDSGDVTAYLRVQY